MMAHQAEAGNAPTLTSLLDALRAFAAQAAADGRPAHEVERQLCSRALAIGREAFALFVRLRGQGDLGAQVRLADGSCAQRLEQPRERTCRCDFGDFTLRRVCCGSREGQKVAFVPLDNRLQLPPGDYSYLLQEWDQALGCDCAFARVAATIEGALGAKQPVDSLERQNRHMARAVEPFRQSRPLPAPQDEGELFVVTDDGKGVPMRRGPGDPPPKARRKKGDKANKKRMAVVGAAYPIDRHRRTPEEVTAALFRDVRRPGVEPARRPAPVGKHAWARLSRAAGGALQEAIDAVFGWQKGELGRRDPSGAKEVLCLMDGQEALWEGKGRHFGAAVVEVLGLLHVTPRLWQAAHLFEKEGSATAGAFVRARVLRVLRGEVKGVVKGLRRLGTTRGLGGQKEKKLRAICNYLAANAARMRYDEYLEKGYPIASGVIEGACRHYVKDRMERSGMRWTKPGAQAMLDVRSEHLNGDWQAFHAFRIHHETQRLYPQRHLLEALHWPLAA